MNPTVKKKTKVPTLTITIKRCLGSINHNNWGGGREEMQSRLEKKKISLFVDEMKVYIENPKDTTRKLPEPIIAIERLKDIKLTHINLLHMYTLTNRKINLGNNYIHHCNKKNKILWNIST